MQATPGFFFLFLNKATAAKSALQNTMERKTDLLGALC